MNRRRGATLAELVICIATGSTLMLLAIGVVHQALSLSSSVQRKTDDAVAWSRLTQQFRSDVHRSIAAEQSEASSLVLRFEGDEKVDYKIEKLEKSRGENSVRVTRRSLRNNSSAEHEAYSLSQSTDGEFHAIENATRVHLVVRHSIGPKPSESNVPQRELTAMVGRWFAVESRAIKKDIKVPE